MTDVLYASHIAYDKGVRKGATDKAREMAKGLREDGVPMDIIVRRSGLSEEEIRAL